MDSEAKLYIIGLCIIAIFMFWFFHKLPKWMEENAFVFFLVASPFYIFIGIMGGYFLIERWNNDNIFSQFLYGLIGTLYIGLIVAAVWMFYEEFFEWIDERKERKKHKRLNS